MRLIAVGVEVGSMVLNPCEQREGLDSLNLALVEMTSLHVPPCASHFEIIAFVVGFNWDIVFIE
jgi:hypothetical protein